MYHLGLQAHNGHVYVMYVHDMPSNQMQITHVWKPSKTLANLTAEEIQDSAARAQEVNRLLTAKQTCDDKPATDVTTEQSTPKVQIIEIPQVIENRLEWEALTEWLQHENIKQEFWKKFRKNYLQPKQNVLLNSRKVHEPHQNKPKKSLHVINATFYVI